MQGSQRLGFLGLVCTVLWDWPGGRGLRPLCLKEAFTQMPRILSGVVVECFVSACQ